MNNDSGQTANVMTTVEPELVSEGIRSIHKIVVAVDLSEHSDLTIQYAVQIAKCFNSSMVLVHVFDSEALCRFSEEYSSRSVDQERDECEVALARLSDAVRDMKVDCKSVVLNGDPAKRIRALARETGADLIVTSTSHPKFLARLLNLSKAHQIMRRAPCPVLVYYEKDRYEWSHH